MGARRAARINAAIEHAERTQYDAATAAHEAGRLAQQAELREALRELDPDHPMLAWTGKVYSNGNRQKVYETAYDEAHDAVAVRAGIRRCRKAMTPRERIMSEPITIRKGWFSERYMWRGHEFRSPDEAEAARRQAADAA